MADVAEGLQGPSEQRTLTLPLSAMLTIARVHQTEHSKSIAEIGDLMTATLRKDKDASSRQSDQLDHAGAPGCLTALSKLTII